MEQNDPIQQYEPKRRNKIEYIGENDIDINYLAGIDSIDDLNYLGTEQEDKYILGIDDEFGEDTEDGAIIFKRKKRRKKMFSFITNLIGKYKQDENYANMKIDKVHFLEELNVGKGKLKKPVKIPTVYAVELTNSLKNELVKYEIYDAESSSLILTTDQNGNLILSEDLINELGAHYKKLGLQKEDEARIREINNRLWISSNVQALKEQDETKANVSEINETIDLQKERIAIALNMAAIGINTLTKLDMSDPLLDNLISKQNRTLKEAYIAEINGEYKLVGKGSNGKLEEIGGLTEKSTQSGKIKKGNNPNEPSKNVLVLERFSIKMGDNTLDLVIYDNGNGNISAGVIDTNDSEKNIIELKNVSGRNLDERVEKIKYDLRDGAIDSKENKAYINLNGNTITENIKVAMKELMDDGVMLSDLNEKEIEKVTREAIQKDKISKDEIKRIIEGEIGVEMSRKNLH